MYAKNLQNQERKGTFSIEPIKAPPSGGRGQIKAGHLRGFIVRRKFEGIVERLVFNITN